MTQAYLTYTGPETRSLGGVGIFAKDLPPLQVSDSIAHQYETPEMKKLGWVVAWKDEAAPATVGATLVVAQDRTTKN